jgi:hypothetical protein
MKKRRKHTCTTFWHSANLTFLRDSGWFITQPTRCDWFTGVAQPMLYASQYVSAIAVCLEPTTNTLSKCAFAVRWNHLLAHPTGF